MLFRENQYKHKDKALLYIINDREITFVYE